MRKATWLGVFMLLGIPLTASAQIPGMGVNVFGGVAVPMGDFGDDSESDEDAGFAKLGFTVGADLIKELGGAPIAWITSISVATHGVDLDADDFGATDADIGRYWLVPIMTGIGYNVPLGPGTLLTPMAQVGLNFIVGPSGTLDFGGEEFEEEYGMATTFGFGVGGILSFGNMSVSARYLSLGTADREVERSGGGVSETFDVEQPVSIAQIAVGFRVR